MDPESYWPFPPFDGVRYVAPELFLVCDFGPKSSNPTKKSDIYAFGVATYRVSDTVSIRHENLSRFRLSQDGNRSPESRVV